MLVERAVPARVVIVQRNNGASHTFTGMRSHRGGCESALGIDIRRLRTEYQPVCGSAGWVAGVDSWRRTG